VSLNTSQIEPLHCIFFICMLGGRKEDSSPARDLPTFSCNLGLVSVRFLLLEFEHSPAVSGGFLMFSQFSLPILMNLYTPTRVPPIVLRTSAPPTPPEENNFGRVIDASTLHRYQDRQLFSLPIKSPHSFSRSADDGPSGCLPTPPT